MTTRTTMTTERTTAELIAVDEIVNEVERINRSYTMPSPDHDVMQMAQSRLRALAAALREAEAEVERLRKDYDAACEMADEHERVRSDAQRERDAALALAEERRVEIERLAGELNAATMTLEENREVEAERIDKIHAALGRADVQAGDGNSCNCASCQASRIVDLAVAAIGERDAAEAERDAFEAERDELRASLARERERAEKAEAEYGVGYVVKWDHEVNRWVSGCPVLDVWSSGDTAWEAIERAIEAVSLFTETLNANAPPAATASEEERASPGSCNHCEPSMHRDDMVLPPNACACRCHEEEKAKDRLVWPVGTPGTNCYGMVPFCHDCGVRHWTGENTRCTTETAPRPEEEKP
jgi:predicted RNase H-like HicB family nuclease